MTRRSVLVVSAVAAVLLSASTVGAAIRPFNPPQTVVGGCASDSGDSVMTASGTLFGYARCQNNVIRFFSRNPDGTVNPSEATGFTGRVLGVAYDSTASYVLFTTAGDIRIGKRTNAGVFSSRTVDGGADSGPLTSGDVIAKDGQWFGVWSKQVTTSNGLTHNRLFSAGSAVSVRPVTTSAALVEDIQPTLAYSGSVPVLIWGRIVDPFTGFSDLYKAKFLAGNWEAPQVFASAGEGNLQPDIAIAGGRTFVTWVRDGYIWVASNATSSGSFSSRMFNTGGYGPNVAASTTSGFVDHIFVTWTRFLTPSSPRGLVFFAESASGGSVHMTWDGATVAPVDTRAIGVGGAGTKATVSYLSLSSVTIRSQA
jgi:hypothetical protein